MLTLVLALALLPLWVLAVAFVVALRRYEWRRWGMKISGSARSDGWFLVTPRSIVRRAMGKDRTTIEVQCRDGSVTAGQLLEWS